MKYFYTLSLILLAFVCTRAETPPHRPLEIHIRFEQLGHLDTLHLYLFSRFFPALEETPGLSLDATLQPEGHFVFRLDHPADYGYFSIIRRLPPEANGTAPSRVEALTPVHFFEAGDSILIHIRPKATSTLAYLPQEKYNYTYTGIGAFKYGLEDRLDSAMSHASRSGPPLVDSMGQVHDGWQSLRSMALDILAENKDSLHSMVARVFRSDIRFANSTPYFLGIRDHLGRLLARGDTAASWRLKSVLSARDWLWDQPGDSRDESLYWSKTFGVYTLAKLNFLSWLRIRKEDPAGVFDSICLNYGRPVRDRLILSYFINNRLANDLPGIYTKAAGLVKDPYCSRALAAMRYRLPGMPAYDFSLPDSLGRMHRLHDLKGKKVLIDAWFTGCGPCAVLYRKVLKELEGSDSVREKVVFVSVSMDKEKERWFAGLASGDYSGPGAVNLYTAGLEAEHPFIKYYRINAYPTLILVDEYQKILRYNTFDLYDASSLKLLLLSLSK